MSLGDAFREAYIRNPELDLLQRIIDAIHAGLWPWKPGKITAYADEFRLEPRWTLELERFPNLPFVAHPDVLRYDFIEVANKLAEEAFHFYRNRPTTPVDDHIVLGEE